jgi:hypothetical protein
MSLIPSESHSFPDNYSPVACSRKAKRKKLSPARPAIEALERNVVPLPAAARQTNAAAQSPAQSPVVQFFQSLGKLAERNGTPPSAPTRETNSPVPSPAQSPDEQFFQSLGKLAERDASPLPNQNDEILSEQNGEITSPVPSPIAQFFQSLEKMADTNGAPLPAPTREITPASPPAAQNVGEQIFQSLENLADSSSPPSPPELAPRRVPIAPIRRAPRQPVAPVSPENVDEATLLTANGRGRAAQYRPKTPMRIPKSAGIHPVQRTQPAVEKPRARQSFAEQPHDEFDFADLSADVERSARRHQKFTRFLLIEIIALAVMLPSAWLVLSRHVTSPALVLLMNILTIAAAVIMAVVPIVLYALAPGFGRPER